MLCSLRRSAEGAGDVNRLAAITAWVLAAIALVVCASVPLLAEGAEFGETLAQFLANLIFLAVAPVFCITAAVVISRLPRHPVGWMLLLIGAGIVMSVPYDIAIPDTAPADPSTALVVMIILASVSWAFFIFPIIHLLLTFPTGRLLSSRWRVLVLLEIALFLYLFFSGVFAAEIGPIENGGWVIPNPIGFLDETWFNEVWFSGGLAVLALGGLIALVLRFVRSKGVERQQMKWLLLGTSGFAASFVVGWLYPASNEDAVYSILFSISLIGIGLAIAVAILRHRLYDIDRIISRTVSYALVISALAGAVALLAGLVGTRFDDPLVVAGTTLAAAALFKPLRTKVQSAVDRRFNRSRYDAEKVMNQFVGSLRDRVEVNDVLDGWRSVVTDTMQPNLVGVWVRQ